MRPAGAAASLCGVTALALLLVSIVLVVAMLAVLLGPLAAPARDD
jgi:hypothetical protein